MVGWHPQLDGHECEQVPRVGDGQGSLAFCSPWDHKESDMTECQKIKSDTVSPSISHEVMGPDAMIFVF